MGCAKLDEPELIAPFHKHLPIQKLIDLGYLRPGKFLEYYDYCGEGPCGKIRWKTNSQTGKRRAFCRCRLGECTLKTDDIRTWVINVPLLIQNLGAALEFTPPFKEVIPQVWSLGRKMRREFYYIHLLEDKVMPSIRAYFEPHPSAVFITTTDKAHPRLKLILPKNPCYSFANLCTMDEDCRLTADMKSVEADLEPATAAHKSKAKSRLEKIDKLVTVMKEHYFLAKAHYRATGGEVLRRPTWAELAKRAEINEMDISRCLKDETAVVLRTLWNSAENPNAILNT
ncbi:hypothetical protein FACS189454_07880 [Planctomycetales bacterium]|nr:hypothetical protein FACS189454_07880 [Planctomycetales bacterium]